MASSSSQNEPEHQVWGRVELNPVQRDSSLSSSGSRNAESNTRKEQIQSFISNVKFHDKSSSTSGSQGSQENEKKRKDQALAGEVQLDAFRTQLTFAPGARVAWSIGSAGHHELFTKRTCKPCAWNWKPVGCAKGEGCDFCHLCVEGEVKRKKQMQRVAQRRIGGRQYKVSL
eukprot:TRINITY_DN72196_c0_g1_i1.p1 TRINITY_DN72196_c0_g1~~TRINITY_DN72196_c0_g1_i1.p1  ORF type:complete len:172 (-),score=24.38 TRINITY_DN72196_c0_g1_i1:52-567(-)